MRVVERRRRDADDVGFAPVAEDAGVGKVLEQRAAAGATAGHAQRQLAPRRCGFARGDDLQRVAPAVRGSAIPDSRSGGWTWRATRPCRRVRTRPAMRATEPARGSADCSAASHRRRASERMRAPSGIASPGRGPTSRRSAGARCVRGAHARSSRRPRPDRHSCTCSGTRPRNPRRCRAGAAAGCRRRARGRNRRSRPAACARRAISGRSNACPVRYCTPGHSTSARRERVLHDRALDRCHGDRAVGFVGLELDQCVGRIAAVEAHLRFQRVAVGRKRAGLHQDRVPLRRRPVEADHHQVQVRRQRVHRDDFRRLRADDVGKACAHQFVVRHPRRGFEEVALDRIARPLVEHFLDHRARAARLQAERVAAEVRLLDARRAAGGGIRRASARSGSAASCARAWASLKSVGHGCVRLLEAAKRSAARAIPARCRGTGAPVSTGSSSSASMAAPGACSPSGNG